MKKILLTIIFLMSTGLMLSGCTNNSVIDLQNQDVLPSETDVEQLEVEVQQPLEENTERGVSPAVITTPTVGATDYNSLEKRCFCIGFADRRAIG